MKAIPLTLQEANRYIDEVHRHHTSVIRDKYRIGCEEKGTLVGVAQVGRPVSRNLDDGRTLEVIRLATNGTKNVCSFLYSRCAKIAKAMGYEKIITYILEREDGTSLIASGWKLEAENCGSGSWNREARPREMEKDGRQKYPIGKKKRYSKIFN